jgi:[ribosomal protein S5]-alanine N-acetyltransferase
VANEPEHAPDQEVDMTLAVLDTPRLVLRSVVLTDAPFFVRLLNEPSWLQNIGDRGVKSKAAAEHYIRNTLWIQYRASGYGMYVLQLRATALPVGICGLVKRDFLPAPDLGFALLPEHVGQGLASQAAHRLLQHLAAARLAGVLYAITRCENQRAVRLLERLGFERQGTRGTPQDVAVDVYVRTLLSSAGGLP